MWWESIILDAEVRPEPVWNPRQRNSKPEPSIDGRAIFVEHKAAVDSNVLSWIRTWNIHGYLKCVFLNVS